MTLNLVHMLGCSKQKYFEISFRFELTSLAKNFLLFCARNENEAQENFQIVESAVIISKVGEVGDAPCSSKVSIDQKLSVVGTFCYCREIQRIEV